MGDLNCRWCKKLGEACEQHDPKNIIVAGIDCDEGPCVIREWQGKSPVIVVYNEGGCSNTEVDLRQLLTWVKQHRPDLLA